MESLRTLGPTTARTVNRVDVEDAEEFMDEEGGPEVEFDVTSMDKFGLEADALVGERADQLHTATESKSWTARVPVRTILVLTTLVSCVIVIVSKFPVTTQDTQSQQQPSELWEKTIQNTDANSVADAPAREEQSSCPPGFTLSHSGYWSNPGTHIPWTNVQHCASSCGADCIAFSLWGGHDCYLYSTPGGATTDDANSMACNKQNGPAPPRETSLLSGVDTPGWSNGHGFTCAGYAAQGWCANGAAAPGRAWTLGAKYNYPERNCVVCGKQAGGGGGGGGGAQDTPGWNNNHGFTCTGYSQQGWCANGAFTAGSSWTGGAGYNYPENNCVVCGKGSRSGGGGGAGGSAGDTPGWTNGHGFTCAGYIQQGWCSNGAYTPNSAWTGGAKHNYPERNCVACGKGRSGPSPPPPPPPTPPTPTPGGDTPGWQNGHGWGCAAYASNNWCAHGTFTAGSAWTGGAGFNHPEHNCVVCGKGGSGGGGTPPPPPAGGVWPADGTSRHCRPNNGMGVQNRQRKDVELWTDAQWNVFSRALTTLYQRGEVDRLSDAHFNGANGGGIHGSDEFLPWHRAFNEELETLLQKEANDCSLTLPVYVWAKQTGPAQHHRTWTWNRYGTLDFRAGANCVTSGVASNWRVRATGSCMSRNPVQHYFATPGVMPSVLTIFQSVRSKTTFTAMSRDVESQHNSFHCWVSGTMCSMRSPSDPIFWAHHSFVDQMWYDWQKYATAQGNAQQANSCGSCNHLFRYNAWATDYVGTVVGDCVKYPATNPRICLSYLSPHTNVRKLGEISPISNPPVLSKPDYKPNTCSTLINQIMSGECSMEELKQIRVVDECRDPEAEKIRLKLAKKWEAVVLEHGQHQGMPHLSTWTTVKKQITEDQQMFLQHPHTSASNDDERAACIKCDFVCSGR